MKFNTRSLKFKLWAYFVLFAALLMLILWFLQIFFLRTYYEEMKIAETRRIANTIISQYGQEDLIESIYSILQKNDLYIHIETANDTIIFSPITTDEEKKEEDSNFFQPKVFNAYGTYLKEKASVRKKLLSSSNKTISIILSDPNTNTNTLAYGAILDSTPGKEVILYIFSPLYPVESTVDILANQLIYVTIISLILAFTLSLYLSNRIAKPIREITKSATKLAKGEYGISFQGGHYSEIVLLADTLTHTSKELAKTETLQRDLISNVSHDLRTPLTMVKSYAEMIRDLSGDNPEKRLKHLQVIIDEADRLNLLVNDLLALSKMQSGVDSLKITNFNLKEVIESILHSYDIYAEKEGYNISFNCPSDILINGDEARIKQVISNLVDNALRYSNDIKNIVITLKEKKNYVRCEIADSGQGIDPKELDHIWERYYKASSNHSRNTVGSGLGLSIVKEILLLHNAKFGVESKLGEGSTFWFELKK
ncbi:sensor histidine kinase [Anaerovorax odorimutans]|uniref:sensor histidine kinase n=1 Tax=Anaerovorax odorimutans TaxID=109327 RepID=UPI00055CB5C0|nr:ATP-binding protein [Anaerovorax odorimutans]